ncbi:hypothetical protein AB7G19_03055 [Bradyrhizobium sp. 215_C5_N1_1]|uniref:hypothetical protein n=1 Tax=unclassified Bradyrhizobium TaxID=2631580 RepID=UPI003F8C80CF
MDTEIEATHVVRDLLDTPLTTRTGVYNSRGVHWRGEGGEERELAAKYRKWGEALQFSHPFVSSNLSMKLAQTYEHEAGSHDTEAGIRRRLR